MRKATLSLAAIVAMSTAVSAKEVVQAPINAQEPMVQMQAIQPVVEKPAFKVNGEFKQELEYLGNRETGDGKSKFRFRPAEGKINLSENLSVDFRSRHEMRAESGQTTDSSNFRTRVYYNHGKMGDSKVGLKSRFRFEKTSPFSNSGSVFGDTNDTGLSDTELEFNYVADYRILGDFKAYMPSFISKFDFGPALRHTWNSKNSDQYANGLGFDLETSVKLPLNLVFDTNVYATNYWLSTDASGVNKDDTFGDDLFLVSVEAMLKGKWDIVKFDDNNKVNFYIEYGMDPYQAASEKIFGSSGADDSSYSLKARNVLTYEHKMTPATTVYVSAVGEFKNGETRQSLANNWEWAPEVIVGWKTKF